MRTVRKALTLLDIFSDQSPEMGLTELATTAGFDKATTRRLLIALYDFGFVEQDKQTKKYRLGAGLLRLARMREQMFPVTRIIQPVVDRLAQETGETAHASWALPHGLSTIAVTESRHASRVIFEMGEMVPYHSTGSGLIFLAHAPEALVQDILHGDLKAHTARTPVEPARVAELIEAARSDGYAVCADTYEPDVIGVGAAILDSSGHACGTIAVASPQARAGNKEIEARCILVRAAAREISTALGSPGSAPSRSQVPV